MFVVHLSLLTDLLCSAWLGTTSIDRHLRDYVFVGMQIEVQSAYSTQVYSY